MQRSRFLVSYDIREPRRLRQVHKTMKSFGQPIQYSVFVCDLDQGEIVALKTQLTDAANLGVDSVMIVPLGRGYDPTVIEFMGRAQTLPDGGPIIV